MMATREQITQRLQKTIKSKTDLEEFVAKWGSSVATHNLWKAEEFIPKNIDRIVRDAKRKGHLDELGMLLGFPSDQHAAHLRNVSTDRRSWIALLFSMLALVASAIALFNKD